MAETEAQVQGAVRRIDLPDGSRAQSTLAHLDYTDAHLVDLPQAQERSAEAWARSALEESPEALRASLRSGWRALGMRVGPLHTQGYVLGWTVRRSTPDVVLLGGTSRLGMQAELLLERHERELLFATLVQFDNPASRGLWGTAIERPHLRAVRYVLEQARGRWA
jgi:transposase